MAFIITGAALMIGGTALGAYGQYQAGQSAEAMANYNAKLANNEATAKEQQSHFETLEMSKQRDRLLASQRAYAAKTGAMISEGTPLLLMAEQAGEAELDILNNQRNRMLEAQALKSQATLDRYSGAQASYAGKVGAFSTLLSGVGSVAMGAAAYNKAGATSSTTRTASSGGYGYGATSSTGVGISSS